MYRNHAIGVVVPAYNEAGLVGRVLETMPAFVDRIYVIDDCSTDGTWDEILHYAAEINSRADQQALPAAPTTQIARETPPILNEKRDQGDQHDHHEPLEQPPDGAVTDGGEATGQLVVPIKHEKNRGVGGAIKTGYERSLTDGIDVTCVMAGDAQMDPDQLDRLIDPVVEGTAVYAKGNRLADPDDRKQMSTWRLFGNVTLTLLTKIASGYWELLDPQNGYTAIATPALERIDLEGLYEEYGFANDLLVELNTAGYTVADVSMPAVYGDEQSHIEYRTFVPRLSKLLLLGFCRRLTQRYVIREFHPLVFLYGLGVVGWLLALAGLAWAGKRRSSAASTATRVSATVLYAFLGSLCLVLAMICDRHVNRQTVVTVR